MRELAIIGVGMTRSEYIRTSPRGSWRGGDFRALNDAGLDWKDIQVMVVPCRTGTGFRTVGRQHDWRGNR